MFIEHYLLDLVRLLDREELLLVDLDLDEDRGALALEDDLGVLARDDDLGLLDRVEDLGVEVLGLVDLGALVLLLLLDRLGLVLGTELRGVVDLTFPRDLVGFEGVL